jgi:steroid delta-isomerase-like uncharacterized protein
MNTMTIEQNKELHRRFLQGVFNEGRMETADELLSPSYVFHDAPPGAPKEGPQAVKQAASMFRVAFPDLEISVEELVAEGDKLCARATTRGTHRGTIFGISATGKTVTVTGLTMVRVADGRIAESWVKNDVLGLLRQLGANSLPK